MPDLVGGVCTGGSHRVVLGVKGLLLAHVELQALESKNAPYYQLALAGGDGRWHARLKYPKDVKMTWCSDMSRSGRWVAAIVQQGTQYSVLLWDLAELDAGSAESGAGERF